MSAYDKSSECFQKALSLFSYPVKPVQIPYENTTLPGYLFLSHPHDIPRPTIIILGGYDSSLEELYPLGALAAVKRGFHCLAFVGPGQGDALIKQHLYMRPDFENVLSPVLDWLFQQPEVLLDKVALVGRSFGGYLAPRGACGEKRLAALVCDPGQMDLATALKQHFPSNVLDMLKNNDKEGINAYFSGIIQHNKMLKFFLKSRINVHGLSDVASYLLDLERYSLADKVNDISCPTLVCDNPNDKTSIRGKSLFDALKCEKHCIVFDKNAGASLHCEAGAAAYFEQQVFDWLNSKLQSRN